jgi:hypothetical protein
MCSAGMIASSRVGAVSIVVIKIVEWAVKPGVIQNVVGFWCDEGEEERECVATWNWSSVLYWTRTQEWPGSVV